MDERSINLWRDFFSATEAAQTKATERLQALEMFNELSRSGYSAGTCNGVIRKQFGFSPSTMYGVRDAICGVKREDWLAALVPVSRNPAPRQAPIHPLFLELMKRAYPGDGTMSFSTCYRLSREVAEQKGWQPLPAERTMRRWFEPQQAPATFDQPTVSLLRINVVGNELADRQRIAKAVTGGASTLEQAKQIFDTLTDEERTKLMEHIHRPKIDSRPIDTGIHKDLLPYLVQKMISHGCENDTVIIELCRKLNPVEQQSVALACDPEEWRDDVIKAVWLIMEDKFNNGSAQAVTLN